jgi:hypothetical protein
VLVTLLMNEIDALRGENATVRAELAEARERAGSQLSPEQRDRSLRFMAKHCDRGEATP